MIGLVGAIGQQVEQRVRVLCQVGGEGLAAGGVGCELALDSDAVALSGHGRQAVGIDAE